MLASMLLRVAVVALLGAPSGPTQQALADPNTVGTLLVAHGGDSIWNSQVHETARAVRTGGPIEVSFLMGPEAAHRRFQDAVARLEAAGARRIVVVPLLVSSHSGHFEQIRYLTRQTDSLDEVMQMHLHHAGIERPSSGVPITVAPALDGAVEMATVLAERAAAAASRPAEQALLLLGHGPNSAEDHAAWMTSLRPVADSVRMWAGFRDVRVGLLREDAPAPVRAEAVRGIRDLIELQRQVTGREVLVVPVLVSRGGIARSRVEADLAGLPVRYTGDALLPHPAMARWIEGRVRAAVAER